MIIAATGHRPNKLLGYSNEAYLAMRRFAQSELARFHDLTKVISGMALGWDMAVAAAAVYASIPFVAVIPFRGQERLWPEESQKRYHALLERALDVVVVSDVMPHYYADVMAAMLERNKRMVDMLTNEEDCLLALHNGSSGGTSHCVAYAKQREIFRGKIDNAWDRWVMEMKKAVAT